MYKNKTVPTKVEEDNNEGEVPNKIEASHRFDDASLHIVTNCDSSTVLKTV